MTQTELYPKRKNSVVLPFLRWAGGKRWLTTGHSDLFPKKFGRYFEPFLGSGAVYFSLRPEAATLSDMNKELIDCYISIRDELTEVKRVLEIHDGLHSSKYYYEIRASAPESTAEKAAKFIYLNRTCWNGLYRVNASGKFNVPIGTRKKVLLQNENFEAVSEILKQADFVSKDFADVIDEAVEGDFIFADPPYTVKHNLNGFISYNEKIFHWNDQERLSNSLKKASDRGCLILLTNANHSSVIELYQDNFKTQALNRSSVIAGNIKNRGKFEELIVKNY